MSITGRKPKDFEEQIVEITEHFIAQDNEFYFVAMHPLDPIKGSSTQDVFETRNAFYELVNTVTPNNIKLVGRVYRDQFPSWVITSDKEFVCLLRLKFGKYIKLVRTFEELKSHFEEHGYWNLQHISDILVLWDTESTPVQDQDAIDARYPPRFFNPPPRIP